MNSLENARPDGSEAAILALRTTTNKSGFKPAERNPLKATAKEMVKGASGVADVITYAAGKLSGLFESGLDGSAAIGYDRTGGTSYGKYQIASKPGTLNEFLSFLDKKAPEWSRRLRNAGPSDTGGKQGRMPEEWKKMAAAEPERFEAMQQEFIQEKHFRPAMQYLGRLTGIEEQRLSQTMQEVVFSTAVQHGPGGACRIIARALERVGLDKFASSVREVADKAEESMIRQVYDIRSEQFGSSTRQVQAAVKSRLQNELEAALNMLKGTRTA